jgi:hypothetical protein
MRRREFIAGLLAWPQAARAQQPSMPVIVFLQAGSAASSADYLDAFRVPCDSSVASRGVTFISRAVLPMASCLGGGHERLRSG